MSDASTLSLLIADRVVAELLRDPVALAFESGELVETHFREEVGEGKLVFGQRREQAPLDAAPDVDGVDHHHVPVARLRLLDDRQPAPVPSNSLTLTLTLFSVSNGSSSAGSAWSHHTSAFNSCASAELSETAARAAAEATTRAQVDLTWQRIENRHGSAPPVPRWRKAERGL
jgi:hypothetical protein